MNNARLVALLTATATAATLSACALLQVRTPEPPPPDPKTATLVALLPDADNPDRIRLAFDREMISEITVGRMEQAAIFQVAPACPGNWIWSARDTLEYLLDSPLPQGRLVKVSATPHLKVITARSAPACARRSSRRDGFSTQGTRPTARACRNCSRESRGPPTPASR